MHAAGEAVAHILDGGQGAAAEILAQVDDFQQEEYYV